MASLVPVCTVLCLALFLNIMKSPQDIIEGEQPSTRDAYCLCLVCACQAGPTVLYLWHSFIGTCACISTAQIATVGSQRAVVSITAEEARLALSTGELADHTAMWYDASPYEEIAAGTRVRMPCASPRFSARAVSVRATVSIISGLIGVCGSFAGPRPTGALPLRHVVRAAGAATSDPDHCQVPAGQAEQILGFEFAAARSRKAVGRLQPGADE